MRMKRNQKMRSLVMAALALAFLCFTATSALAGEGDLMISEFRLRGPQGANDEFIEIYNDTDSPYTVQTIDGSAGFALVASDGVKRFTIPNGTVIPARGHFLGVNSVGYSLASYPAGNGTTATGDATYTMDIPDNAGIALFRTANPLHFTSGRRLDAVGSNAELNPLYYEGNPYQALTPFSIDYSFYRNFSYGSEDHFDSNDNANDFSFVDTNGTSAGAGQRLGAPGPENLSSPTHLVGVKAIFDLDPGKCANCAPNRLRDKTSDPAHNSTFGTETIRLKYTNQGSVAIDRLRVRLRSVKTFPSPSGEADMRAISSNHAVVSLNGGGTVNVQGTKLEEPSSQPNGGAFNSSLSVESVTPANPLAPGASVNFQVVFGIQQDGDYLMWISVETLPGVPSGRYQAEGSTDEAPDTPPTLDLNGPAAGDSFHSVYNENSAPVAITSPNLAIEDTTSKNLKSARARLTIRPDGADEALAVSTAGTQINAAYHPSTGVLSLAGWDTLANYRKVLRTLTYQNNSDRPDQTQRLVDVTANDGEADSAATEATIQVKAVNDAPVVSAPATINTQANAPVVFNAGAKLISIADADAGNATVQVTLLVDKGLVTLNGVAGLDFLSGDGTDDAGMTFTGKLSDINARLKGMSFKPNQNFTGKSALVVIANDKGNAGQGGVETDKKEVAINVANPGVLQFSAATYAAGTEGSAVTVTVKRTNGTDGTVKVNYATADASALAGQDYTSKQSTLTFLDGEASKTFTVATTNDSKVEAKETFKVKLSNPTNGSTIGAQAAASVSIEDDDVAAPDESVQFSQPAYAVAEGKDFVTVTVTRSGDTSKAASVEYSSDGLGSLVNCDVVIGIATPRCDYATDLGVLRFAPGVKSKTFTVSIIDDAYVDGTETTQLRLSNPSGASLGVQSQAQLTITDNDGANGASNPVDSAPDFVRQQYLDFLGREPDPAGKKGWLDVLNKCAAGNSACDRIEVSAGFFRSTEFQERGYFVYRFYDAALGQIPAFVKFMPDLARLSGFQSAAELEASKQAFVAAFMARPEFKTKYGSLTTPTAYVDELLQTAGLPNHPSRGAWINGLKNKTLTRGDVLRSFAESTEVYQKFYDRGFVVMQYFGYLRRDPDISYLNWLDVMKATNGDYRVMVNGFLNSVEFRARFGKP